jgi:hypothetical protein
MLYDMTDKNFMLFNKDFIFVNKTFHHNIHRNRHNFMVYVNDMAINTNKII